MTRDEFWSAFRHTLGLSASEDELEARCLFSGGVFSHEAGVRKPDPRIYRLLLRTAHVEARQALFIDDKEWALAPAARLGMTTVLFQDIEQVRWDLVRLGVLRHG